MGRVHFLMLVILSVLLWGCFPQPLLAQSTEIAVTSSSRQLLFQAERVLANVKSTQYSHTSEVDEAEGLYRLDCSAFISFLLSSVVPQALRSVSVDPRHSHARAINFYTRFSNTPAERADRGWRRIVRLMDAEPGDIVAWRKDPLPKKGNTGHVLMILEKPVMEDDEMIRVRVLDASRSGHFQDTRKKGSGGVGAGMMWFRVDSEGRPVAYHWSTRKKLSGVLPIAIGRAMAAESSGSD